MAAIDEFFAIDASTCTQAMFFVMKTLNLS